MCVCDLLQVAHGSALELHQVLARTWVLHLDLPLALLWRAEPQSVNYTNPPEGDSVAPFTSVFIQRVFSQLLVIDR